MKTSRLYSLFRLLEAWILLHVCRLVILVVPFRKIMGILGVFKQDAKAGPHSFLGGSAVGFAIKRARRFTLHRSKCYDQALAAKWMLKIRGISSSIYFGVAKDPATGLSAHAWVTIGDQFIVGREGVEKFTPLVWFGD
jgi:hypothetical protein